MHIAIIPDGNGRWAQLRNLSRSEGHKRGGRVLFNLILRAINLKIRYLSIYTFSSDNWKRENNEVNLLMGLHELYCKKLMEFREVEMIWAGDRKNMPQNLITLFSQYEEKEKRINDPKKIRLTIIIYCNYSFEDDITRAVRLMIGKSKKEEVDPDEIGFEEIKAACYASTIPDIDILIRSSGELRLSNFDMLRMSYTEFFFIDKLWPDFTTIDLLKILESFRKRIRRYGGVVNKV